MMNTPNFHIDPNLEESALQDDFDSVIRATRAASDDALPFIPIGLPNIDIAALERIHQRRNLPFILGLILLVVIVGAVIGVSRLSPNTASSNAYSPGSPSYSPPSFYSSTGGGNATAAPTDTPIPTLNEQSAYAIFADTFGANHINGMLQHLERIQFVSQTASGAVFCIRYIMKQLLIDADLSATDNTKEISELYTFAEDSQSNQWNVVEGDASQSYSSNTSCTLGAKAYSPPLPHPQIPSIDTLESLTTAQYQPYLGPIVDFPSFTIISTYGAYIEVYATYRYKGSDDGNIYTAGTTAFIYYYSMSKAIWTLDSPTPNK